MEGARKPMNIWWKQLSANENQSIFRLNNIMLDYVNMAIFQTISWDKQEASIRSTRTNQNVMEGQMDGQHENSTPHNKHSLHGV